MEKVIKHLKKEAAQKAKENRQFFKKLKRRPPKDLDYTMQELHDAEFSQTDCLQCANCCKTIGPMFTNADIERISKYLKMKSSDFVETYLRVDEDNDHVLQQLPCVFLGFDNQCSIYSVRPKACREFPHTNRKKFYQISELTLKNVAICPAAFQIVEAMKQHINM